LNTEEKTKKAPKATKKMRSSSGRRSRSAKLAVASGASLGVSLFGSQRAADRVAASRRTDAVTKA